MKDAEKVLLGAGILGGVVLAAYLVSAKPEEKPEEPPACPPGSACAEIASANVIVV